MTAMTDNDLAGSAPHGGEPATSGPGEEPGYLTETGQAASEDGSVAPIIGGLPAVEGSSWDIGAAVEDRGANLADQQRVSRPDQAGREDTSSG
jgi:hypothetical protein